MRYPMNRALLTPVVMFAFLALITAYGFAQARDAGAKMRGEFGGTNRSAARSMRHAYDYSRDYRVYSEDVRKVDPQTALMHSEGIGRNLNQAKKDFAQIRKAPELDKQTLSDLAQIEKHLKAATATHAKLHEACMKAEVDAGVSMECCDDINAELSKAIELHEKVMKRLGGNAGGNTKAKTAK